MTLLHEPVTLRITILFIGSLLVRVPITLLLVYLPVDRFI